MIKIDRHTVIQILGGLMNRPDFLNDVDKYRFELSDFPTSLDKFIFSAINNLYNNGDGASNIRSIDIINYLKGNALAAELMEKENGEVYLQDCETAGEPANFNYYYNKFKKLNFLKDLQKNSGRDISDIYCEDILNPNYAEINERFEQMTVEDILNKLKMELNSYESKFVLKSVVEESKAVDGIEQLIIDLQQKPEIGCKLQGDIINSITRGGRKGKLYIRSAGSGVGKTRSMVGDACNIAYPIRFDRKKNKWVSTGSCEKVLYVMTEQDPDEIKTMILAYLTGYNEEIFLYGTYGEKEMPRIQQAIDIMKKYEGNMLFAHMPDPCASAVKNLFRRYNIQHGVENIFYDYIFSSPAMLNEYRDLKLREDVCLRLFTTTLKNLAVELNAFIMTST
jgi:replicative DNA helicase